MTTTTQVKSNKLLDIWKAFVRLQNPMMIWLLRSPLHFFVSNHYMLITFTGRKSGKTYTTPVQYKWVDKSHLFVISSEQYRWWKNLRDGAKAMLYIKRQSYTATTEISLEPSVIRKSLEDMYPSMNAKQETELVETAVVLTMTVK